MRKLFYLPLEPLAERYTVQLSAAKKGWLERRWIEEGLDYVRIEGKSLTHIIKNGTVLDANGRGFWAVSQIQEVLRLLDAEEITSEDALYFDDFWHPGISALPYSFALTKVRPKLYAMVHAQSVDIHDFTYPMRHWMRHFEKGIGKVLDGIFVTSTVLKDLLLYAGIGNEEKIHLTGLPFNSEEVKTHWPVQLPKKRKQVVFSSRWDKEKCPLFFCTIINEIMKRRSDIDFIITTSAKSIRSNSPEAIRVLKDILHQYPNNIFLREAQTKQQYYTTLLESMVQINTADQDFVSWTLLEATTCGCIPLYPYFLSFPEALRNTGAYMYVKNDTMDAANKLEKMIDGPTPNIFDFKDIYERYDASWKRMLNVIKSEPYEPLYNS